MRKFAVAWDSMTPRVEITAADLPSNRALPNDVTVESLQVGWTTQQPYAHARCSVALSCALCGTGLDRNDWGTHPCLVGDLVGSRIWVGPGSSV